jgi:hypothetical protein
MLMYNITALSQNDDAMEVDDSNTGTKLQCKSFCIGNMCSMATSRWRRPRQDDGRC